MLEVHFLRKFFKNFLVFFLSLVFILGISDFLVRLQSIGVAFVTPKLFFYMFPLMAQFAIPLASCLAIQTTVGNLFVEDDAIMIYFLYPAKQAMHKTVLWFSLILVAIYMPLVFVWAPAGYQKGKKLILDFAKEQFYTIEPNKLYSITPRFSFFFKERFLNVQNLYFKKVLLVVNEKNGNRYIINSEFAYLNDNNLLFNNGYLINSNKDKSYFNTFKECTINLDSFLNSNQNVKDIPLNKPKFLTIRQLKAYKDEKENFYIEYYKRIVQVVWQFIFPFLALWAIVIFSKRKSNLFLSILISGFLFLFSYFSVNVVSSFYTRNINYLLYFPLVAISSILYFLYTRKK